MPTRKQLRSVGCLGVVPPVRLQTDTYAPIRAAVGRGVEEIHVQVSLTRQQALYGGRIRVRVPMRIRCPSCRGRGGAGYFECLHSFGSATVVDEYPVDIAFPGGLSDGFTGRVSLSRPGMRDLALVLHFEVDG